MPTLHASTILKKAVGELAASAGASATADALVLCIASASVSRSSYLSVARTAAERDENFCAAFTAALRRSVVSLAPKDVGRASNAARFAFTFLPSCARKRWTVDVMKDAAAASSESVDAVLGALIDEANEKELSMCAKKALRSLPEGTSPDCALKLVCFAATCVVASAASKSSTSKPTTASPSSTSTPASASAKFLKRLKRSLEAKNASLSPRILNQLEAFCSPSTIQVAFTRLAAVTGVYVDCARSDCIALSQVLGRSLLLPAAAKPAAAAVASLVDKRFGAPLARVLACLAASCENGASIVEGAAPAVVAAAAPSAEAFAAFCAAYAAVHSPLPQYFALRLKAICAKGSLPEFTSLLDVAICAQDDDEAESIEAVVDVEDLFFADADPIGSCERIMRRVAPQSSEMKLVSAWLSRCAARARTWSWPDFRKGPWTAACAAAQHQRGARRAIRKTIRLEAGDEKEHQAQNLMNAICDGASKGPRASAAVWCAVLDAIDAGDIPSEMLLDGLLLQSTDVPKVLAEHVSRSFLLPWTSEMHGVFLRVLTSRSLSEKETRVLSSFLRQIPEVLSDALKRPWTSTGEMRLRYVRCLSDSVVQALLAGAKEYYH